VRLDDAGAEPSYGAEEGRRTFANILKYVRMGASSNFGNMVSMAVASSATIRLIETERLVYQPAPHLSSRCVQNCTFGPPVRS
jgi:hypothetical protein